MDQIGIPLNRSPMPPPPIAKQNVGIENSINNLFQELIGLEQEFNKRFDSLEHSIEKIESDLNTLETPHDIVPMQIQKTHIEKNASPILIDLTDISEPSVPVNVEWVSRKKPRHVLDKVLSNSSERSMSIPVPAPRKKPRYLWEKEFSEPFERAMSDHSKILKIASNQFSTQFLQKDYITPDLDLFRDFKYTLINDSLTAGARLYYSFILNIFEKKLNPLVLVPTSTSNPESYYLAAYRTMGGNNEKYIGDPFLTFFIDQTLSAPNFLSSSSHGVLKSIRRFAYRDTLLSLQLIYKDKKVQYFNLNIYTLEAVLSYMKNCEFRQFKILKNVEMQLLLQPAICVENGIRKDFHPFQKIIKNINYEFDLIAFTSKIKYLESFLVPALIEEIVSTNPPNDEGAIKPSEAVFLISLLKKLEKNGINIWCFELVTNLESINKGYKAIYPQVEGIPPFHVYSHDSNLLYRNANYDLSKLHKEVPTYINNSLALV